MYEQPVIRRYATTLLFVPQYHSIIIRFLDIWLHPVIFLPFVPLPRVMTHTQYSIDTETGGYTQKGSGGERRVSPGGSVVTGGQCHRHSRM
jgi:hypothetical protein